MKILHCCLSNFYIDNYNYQENALPVQNKLDGHEVKIIASTETYIDNAKLGYVKPSSYTTSEGIPVVRLPYSRILPHFIMKKLRAYKGVMKEIEAFNPDVILFHGCQGWELLTVAGYKKKHPGVRLYTDNHAEYYSSARNPVSIIFLHKIFYAAVLKRAYPYIDRIFYVRAERKAFLQELYKLPEEKMEFYPLGGHTVSIEQRSSLRANIRNELNASDGEILLCTSGKQDAGKRLEDVLTALSRTESDKLKLIIIGSIPEERKPVLEPMIKADKRVSFLGWKSNDELKAYLCASDLYIQPGNHSITIEDAMCCGAALMIPPDENYKHLSEQYGMKDNCFFVKTVDDITKVFCDIIAYPDKLTDMGQKSLEFAARVLDYSKLAERLYDTTDTQMNK